MENHHRICVPTTQDGEWITIKKTAVGETKTAGIVVIQHDTMYYMSRYVYIYYNIIILYFIYIYIYAYIYIYIIHILYIHVYNTVYTYIYIYMWFTL